MRVTGEFLKCLWCLVPVAAMLFSGEVSHGPMASPLDLPVGGA